MSVPTLDDPLRTPRARGLLTVTTVGFVGLHVFHARVQGGGGWRARHGGLLGAIWQFFRLSADDPVLSAGLSDFAVVATLFGMTLVFELPPGQRWTLRTKLWLVLYTLFPGLGALVFLLFLRPRRTGNRSTIA